MLHMNSSKHFQENSLLQGEHQLSFPTLEWLADVLSTMVYVKHTEISRSMVQDVLLKVFTETSWVSW